ncbi:hypothetical protein PGT21_035039 [Puccinia graminis f. sp. tritici]|uniref:Uncharacterized protein n=1 Tax=Puccinia graminis f. sp. tritici TaxID=56615 RepID=A0A5B0NSP1_PUCGR|nr:hypothetical protein PGTUg99_036362 [Puccinia graminis f. sp. tritici]KAA1091514.1 hypothetical protein PGT21_035039 [Puccinia graminis f. sp. tritici]
MVVRQLVVVNGSPSDAVAQFLDIVSAIIGKNVACSHRALQDNDSDVMGLSSTTSYRCTFEIPQAVLELVPFVLSVPQLLAPAQVMEN